MAPYATVTLTFTANVPADISLLGTMLNYVATVSNSASETNTTNNTTLLDVTITGSYDPNDKHGITSSRTSGDQYFRDQDTHIDYTVRFQNTGTAAAETVVIRDVLDTDLDITSLQVLGASHAFTPSFGEGRELVLTFNAINLPDSTADLLGSQGYISYRIKPDAGIMVGEIIENNAGIYFDFNPPIITNTATHVVEISTGIAPASRNEIQVMPNPANEVLYVSTPTNSTGLLQVFTIDGRMMHVPATHRENLTELDVRDLAPGTYIMRTLEGAARFMKQ